MLPLLQLPPHQHRPQVMAPSSHLDPCFHREYNTHISDRRSGNGHGNWVTGKNACNTSKTGSAVGPVSSGDSNAMRNSGNPSAAGSDIVQNHDPTRLRHALAFQVSLSSAASVSPAPNVPTGCVTPLPLPSGPNHQTQQPPHHAFPIRTSQPSVLRGLNYSQPEHQLRRKTPNGTIDAGYDGSPAQLATGPPPLKQLVLPAGNAGISTLDQLHTSRFTSNADQWNQTGIGSFLSLTLPQPTPPISSAVPSVGGVWHQHQHQQSRSRDTMFADNAFVSGPIVDCQGPLPLNIAQFPYQTALNIPQLMPHPFSHAIAYCPPPVWEAGPYVPNHPTVGGRVPGNENVGLDGQYSSNSRPSLLNLGSTHRHTFGPGPQIQLGHSSSGLAENISGNSCSPYGVVRQQQSQIAFQQPDSPLDPTFGLQFANMHLPQDETSSIHFRGKVLQQAHKIYTDLLSYLHATKRILGKGRNNQSRTLQRLVVYPKPPPCPSSTQQLGRPKLSHSATDFSYREYHDSSVLQAQPRIGLAAQQQLHNGIISKSAMVRHSHDYIGNGTSVPLSRAPAYPGYERTISGPVANAKASIDMLTSLCEQSEWKWIDGMLLGGCLQYGLERYEEALQWFSRILNLDASHTEALSNTAATLYCLNRPHEAEQHWTKAIKLRPAYLEAVEHLVGLLGASQRSHEVVNIINHVQMALKLRRGAEATYGNIASSQTPGFGSSGYAVPGEENGRIIALIHIKGNMLYALKDIDGASEAFEEAVLISAGQQLGGVQELILRIHNVLSPPGQAPSSSAAPLLLPPETARKTAQFVFASDGGLPGLHYVPDGSSRRSAVSTTSNSLLSLAKIFQDAISSGTSLSGYSRQPPGVGDILALYYLSLSLMESPSTANNVGILLASVQQSANTLPSTQEMTQQTQQLIPGIVPGSGLALALSYYRYGLSLDSKHVHLHTNLGSLLKDIGQLDLAISMYQRAVECDKTFDIALTNLANAVKDKGRITEAIDYYRRAVKSNPRFSEAVCGLSTALNSVCDWRGRGGVVLHRGKFDRWHVDEEGMLQDCRLKGTGSGLINRVVEIVNRQLAESSKWGKDLLRGSVLSDFALQLHRSGACPTNSLNQLITKLQEWAGRPWEGSRVLRLVERATRVTTRRWYLDRYVHSQEKDSSHYPRVQLPAVLSVPAAPTVLPFHTFTCPLTAKAIRMISQRNAYRISCSTLRSSWISPTVYPPPAPPRPCLNVGYVSSDFNNHPLAHLMQSVFGMHDGNRVKAFCYATTASDKSHHRLQIEREAPVFRDVSTWGADKLVGQIVSDGIHILVNLNGYTRGARNEIFAARPAPIQMSFMGFAGTLGAEWCDYLLADETAVPRSTLRPWRSNVGVDDIFVDEKDTEVDDWVYSENIVYCRDTFFCCDHAQSCEPSERHTTWEMEQKRRWDMRKTLFPDLSDDAIIMGNFNQLYKIDPTTFRTWLRILSNAPKAYLWLLRFPEVGETHLKRTAMAWAGEKVAKRILFTDVAPKQQHITRARVCDLFLDTPECNAHTTAADVLWSSTPLLTLPRYPYKMCSRMAASILKGALPKNAAGQCAAEQLVAADEERYEEVAVSLVNSMAYEMTPHGYGSGKGQLWELRKLLFDNKWSCALFNTRRWVRDLEDAYEEAWRRWIAGRAGDIEL